MAQGVPGRLRPRIFLTFPHYKGGRSSSISTGRLYPRISSWYSLSEAESTSGHIILSGEPRKKSPVSPPGIDPGTVRLVAQRLNHYSTPGRILYIYIILFCLIFQTTRSRDRFPVVSLGIFSVVPPTEPCALKSTQSLKVSTRHFSWGKGGRCVWLTTYHPCSAETSR